MDKIEPVAQPEPMADIPQSAEQTGIGMDIHAMKLEGFFGIQNPSSEEQKSLSEMTRLLNGNNMDVVDFLWEVKNVENRIGTPPLGMSRLQHTYNFIKINSQILDLEKERNLYVQ